ncbi:MAG: hypothetical protein AMS21_00785 [Gemmatimonas sp. SG8_38_2]|nr:MAG: hypothetical protein AMS21_00785 [Gemmatimonas sp. SG8_38_2]
MRPLLAKNIAQVLGALNMEAFPGIPNTVEATNQILLHSLILQKILIAASDVGIDWDAYEVWIEPGQRPTLITQVQPGDIVVVKLVNNDSDNAGTVYYEQNVGVRPGTNLGLEFPPTTIAAPANLFDFNEAGPNFAAVVAPGIYATGAALAAALQAAIAAVAPANTYAVTSLDGARLFQIQATNAVPIPFNIVPATGPNRPVALGGTGLSMAPQIGWITDDAVGAAPWMAVSDSPVVNAVPTGGVIRNGYPLFAGETNGEIVVLESNLYGILDPSHTLRVPVSVRHSRIVTRNRT